MAPRGAREIRRASTLAAPYHGSVADDPLDPVKWDRSRDAVVAFDRERLVVGALKSHAGERHDHDLAGDAIPVAELEVGVLELRIPANAVQELVEGNHRFLGALPST